MYNDWLTIGGLTIHGYGVMIAIGILAAFWLGERLAKKTGLDAGEQDNLILVALAAGFFGSKVTYILTDIPLFLQNPLAVLGNSGWVVFGGILGGILGAYIYCRLRKIPFLPYLNLSMVLLALAQGFGRIGCFFAGCCYGKPTHGALGVVFSHSDFAPNNVRLIPTQLLSSFGDFVLFAILYTLFKDEKKRSKTAAWYLVLYSAGRFVIEFLRGDTVRGFIGVLSTSQAIGIVTFAAGIYWLWKSRSEQPKPQEAIVSEEGERK